MCLFGVRFRAFVGVAGASAEIILSLSATEVARLSLTSENAELVSKLSAEQVSYPSVAVKLNEGNPVRFAAVNLTYLAESGYVRVLFNGLYLTRRLR